MTDTRTAILEKNFEAMQLHGFQGTRSDKIVEDLGITKGAFYYYFPNKKSLGYAILDEMLGPGYLKLWGSMRKAQGPAIDRIINVIRAISDKADAHSIRVGCPLNNLVQEMAPIDDGFKSRLDGIVHQILDHIQVTLEEGIQNGSVKKSVNAAGAAHLIWAAMEGSFSIGKATQSVDPFKTSVYELIRYLESLRT